MRLDERGIQLARWRVDGEVLRGHMVQNLEVTEGQD